jgi:hypothetical protein
MCWRTDGESCQVYLCLQRHGGPSQAHIRFERGFASKVQSRTWKQSVPSAVADGLPSRNAKLLFDYKYARFTHPLPRTVLTVSKRDVLT